MQYRLLFALAAVAGPLAAQQPSSAATVERAAARVIERADRAAVAKTVERALDSEEFARAEAFGLSRTAFAFDVASAVSFKFDASGFSRAGGGQATPADSLYRRAHDEMNRGDYRKAATLFKDVWGKYPNAGVGPDAMYWQAHALYRVGTTPDLQDALAVLDQLRTKYPARNDRGKQGDVGALQVRIAGVLSTRGMGGQDLVKRALAENANVCDREDQQVRAAALNALMQTDRDAAIQYAQRMLTRKDDCSTDLRRSAVFLLGNKRDVQASATLITVARTDPDYGVRASAINYLGRLPGDDALTALEELTRAGEDDRIKREAIRALARHESPRARASLRALVERSENSETLRMSALDALEPERATADDLAWLQGLYAKVESPRMKARVISAVARIGGAQNEKWFTTLANNENESIDVRLVAVQRVGPTMDIAALGKLYDATGQRRLRMELVKQFGRRKEAEATDKLVSIAKTGTDVEVRRGAIDALVRKKDPRATKLLLELIEK
ncbi:MAG: HEAT repeat domain-containing protein [Gemmatimonadaceae bacterium]|nr:HEAT repeat domain-containing protein [Gemmatimonadaceae bacterium]